MYESVGGLHPFFTSYDPGRFKLGRRRTEMPPFEEKPFRSGAESGKESAEITIRMGHPRVRPHVVPFAGKTGELTSRTS